MSDPTPRYSRRRSASSTTSRRRNTPSPSRTQRPGTDVLPDQYCLANGDSAFEAPGGTLFATAEHVHTERILAGAAGTATAPA